MAEGSDRCDQNTMPPPDSFSPVSSHGYSSTQTWPPVESPLRPPWSDHQTGQDEESGDGPFGMRFGERSPAPRFYEELFCAGRASIPLAPLAGALVSSSEPQGDVVKRGYLGKLERHHRRYFVLRAGSHTGPSRLEWYKSQEKFTAVEKSAGKAALFGSSKQGVIYLRCCLGVSRIGSSRKGHAAALYAKDQTMVLVMEDEKEQDQWYVALKKLMEEEQKEEEHGEGVEEEDDGYCTLPSASFFREVWPVTVKPRGLGTSKSLTGENRLCLTPTSLILVRLGAGNDLPSVTIPLLSVRRFGHLDGLFYLEVGRSAPNGPGEIWMEAREQGNPAVAQHIHEAVREMVRALRALPDFSRSPTSSQSQNQAFLASKRCRPKYREKLVNGRAPGAPATLPRAPHIQTAPAQCYQTPRRQEETQPESSLSSAAHLSPFRAQHHGSVPGSYMEMKKEALGYMTMSPQVCHSSSVLPQDDYVTMASPHKHDRPSSSSSSSSLHTSFNSSTSVCHSPLHQSVHCQTHWLVASVQQSEIEINQSRMSISCSAQPQDHVRKEQTSARHSARTSPVESVDGSDLTRFDLSGSVHDRPLQAGPVFDTGQSSRLQAVPAVRRYWLSLCLPSCLQAERTDECQ
ncbi:insulin receptor substrate 2-A-like [Mugil cephalus]|uniref:insulin receptor substrate 2-A-like n=1 Tax=Mugil cephalus TaxID=48193 RepID=UPI001FB7FB3B|nr:insulin receptor substrate 2-A-like [Mugil cephalus]